MEVFMYEWSNNAAKRMGYVTARELKMARQKVVNKCGEGEITLTHFMTEDQFNDLIYKGNCETFEVNLERNDKNG